MDKEKLIQRLMTTFLAELDEHVRSFNRDLLALEKDPGGGSAELLRTLFRAVHSLKGASRSVNVKAVETACHQLESILGAASDGLRPLGPELIQLFFAAADALKDAGERLRQGQDLSASPIQALLPKLEAAAHGGGGAPLPAPAPPQRAPSGPGPPIQSARDGFMRVSAEKLDSLVARSGELLVARRRAASRLAEVALLHESIQRSRSEWARLEEPLRKLLKSNGSSTEPSPFGEVPEGGARSGDQGGSPAGARPARNRAGQLALLPKRAIVALERTRENLKQLERSADLLSGRVLADQRLLEQAAAPLEDEIRRVRMLPFGDACEGLDRVVRDLAQAGSKEVDLVIEGADVELDRAVLEGLRGPLLHLVRNAVDHGVETPDERRAHGKSQRAKVTVGAALRGGGVAVTVADDGRGVDLKAIREQARRRRMPVALDDREAAQLIFLPGFSTASLITELSGRGVGLDVVNHAVQSLHGHVDLTFEPGRGTRFALTVPLTLTTIRALLLVAGGQIFALPATSIRRLVRVGPKDLTSIEGREVLLLDGPPVPVASLVEVLGLDSGPPQRSGGKVALVVVAAGEAEVAFAVDELIAEQECVVKSLGARLRRVRNFAGGVVLPTGHVALILNAADLVQKAIGRAPERALATAFDAEGDRIKKRVLVVDDSVTTRNLEKSLIEAAGYVVLVAADGGEAWQLLQEKGADLVVSDVEMPRMDGFELCTAIRGSKRLRDLPVILVTALESDRDKARGLEAGADAYLPKSAFDQRQLLETIAQLL